MVKLEAVKAVPLHCCSFQLWIALALVSQLKKKNLMKNVPCFLFETLREVFNFLA